MVSSVIACRRVYFGGMVFVFFIIVEGACKSRMAYLSLASFAE